MMPAFAPRSAPHLVHRICRARLGTASARPILGVAPTASTAEIKAAFRREALKCHPDLPGGSEARFRELQEATQAMLASRRPGASAQARHDEWAARGHAQQQEEDEELRREWEEDVRAERERRKMSSDELERNRRLFRLICAWVTLGAIFKLVLLQMASSARKEPLLAAYTQPVPGSGGWRGGGGAPKVPAAQSAPDRSVPS